MNYQELEQAKKVAEINIDKVVKSSKVQLNEYLTKQPHTVPRQWMIKQVLKKKVPEFPRSLFIKKCQEMLQGQLKDFNKIKDFYMKEAMCCELISECQNLYDIAYIVEMFIMSRNEEKLQSTSILSTISKSMGKILNLKQDQMNVEKFRDYVYQKKKSAKIDSSQVFDVTFDSQRKQYAKIYRLVLKPMFQKKNLNDVKRQMVKMVFWLVLMDPTDKSLLFDMAKKLYIFIIVSEKTVEYEQALKYIMDITSVKYARNDKVSLTGLCPLLNKFSRQCNLQQAVDNWITLQIEVVDVLEFENTARNLTAIGQVIFGLRLLYYLTVNLKKLKKYNVLLRIFSSFIRKQLIRVVPQQGVIHYYMRVIEIYMIGFLNHERFEGEEMDQLTTNLGEYYLHRDNKFLSKSTSLESILTVYGIYEIRFCYLSQYSKKFINQLQNISKFKLNITDLHAKIQEYMIKQAGSSHQDEYDLGMLQFKDSDRYRGLRNLGNTCYFNAFLQALYMTKKFRLFIHSLASSSELPSYLSQIYALFNVFQELSKKQFDRKEEFIPDYFKMELPEPFKSTNQQQDSAQFGRIYLESLVVETSKQSPNFREKIEKIFFQKTLKSITCLECQKDKQNNQIVFDLILNLDKSSDEICISRLIKQYFKVEHFDNDNKIFCNNCSRKTKSFTELKPNKFSDILVITLGLFEYEGEGKKILKPFDFEFTLSLGEIFPGSKFDDEYELFAFVLHLGGYSSSGHYICYARNLQENPMIWYCFDDSFVGEKEIAKKFDFNFGEMQTPYMLFYSLKTEKLNTHLKMKKTLSLNPNKNG